MRIAENFRCKMSHLSKVSKPQSPRRKGIGTFKDKENKLTSLRMWPLDYHQMVHGSLSITLVLYMNKF